MTTALPRTALQLRSLIRPDGELELSLAEIPVPVPKADEVLVRIEASPLNPSDLGLLFGAADMATLKASGTASRPVVKARVPEAAMKAMAARVGQAMPVGNEGAGVVVAAGASHGGAGAPGQDGGDARRLDVRAVPLPAGCTNAWCCRRTRAPADGASCFVNPMTALTMVATMRREGHKAIVHTAAASNLGQMLQRLCPQEAYRAGEHRAQARAGAIAALAGRAHVCDSSSPNFTAGADRCAGRDRRNAGLRRHRRRPAGGADPGLHGNGPGAHRHDLQPLRLADAQAGVPLRQPRHRPHPVQPQLRHGLGHGRLAGVRLHAEARSRERCRPSSSASPRN